MLREEVVDGGALCRAVERLGRVSLSLGMAADPHSASRAVEASHHALADTLAIGGAVRSALSPRGRQCLEALASAQRVLYPIALAHGVDAPPPVPRSEPEPAGAERRRSRRLDLAVDVGFETANNFYQGFSEDLSDGGLFVATYQLEPVGTIIEIEFTLPNGHIVRARGEVRWLRDLRNDSADVQPGMGLRFVGLPEEDKRAIKAFTEARNPLFYDDED